MINNKTLLFATFLAAATTGCIDAGTEETLEVAETGAVEQALSDLFLWDFSCEDETNSCYATVPNGWGEYLHFRWVATDPFLGLPLDIHDDITDDGLSLYNYPCTAALHEYPYIVKLKVTTHNPGHVDEMEIATPLGLAAQCSCSGGLGSN